MEIESKLMNRFFVEFWLLIIGIALLSLVIFLLLIFISKIISRGVVKNHGSLFFIMIICMFFNGWLIYTFIPYGQDRNDVRLKDFSYISGEVVGYNKRVAIGDIAVSYRYSQPIIVDDDGNQIILNANNTELNRTYSFIYLRKTKIAFIIDE
jgi:hypothetical protein